MPARKGIKIPTEKAVEGIDSCLKNSKSFLETAKSLVNKNIDHALGLLLYALEELGKAKMIFDGLQKGGRCIVFEKSGKKGNPFYDHEYKLIIGSRLLDLPNNQKIALSLALGEDASDYLSDPVVFALLDSELRTIKGLTQKGHILRLSGFFVEYDEEKREWRLGSGIRKTQLEEIINSVEVAIENFSLDIKDTQG